MDGKINYYEKLSIRYRETRIRVIKLIKRAVFPSFGGGGLSFKTKTNPPPRMKIADVCERLAGPDWGVRKSAAVIKKPQFLSSRKTDKYVFTVHFHSWNWQIFHNWRCVKNTYKSCRKHFLTDDFFFDVSVLSEGVFVVVNRSGMGVFWGGWGAPGLGLEAEVFRG